MLKPTVNLDCFLVGLLCGLNVGGIIRGWIICVFYSPFRLFLPNDCFFHVGFHIQFCKALSSQLWFNDFSSSAGLSLYRFAILRVQREWLVFQGLAELFV